MISYIMDFGTVFIVIRGASVGVKFGELAFSSSAIIISSEN